ncbi:MarR family winged helix-turn-helix transcriptional regulator [Planctomicrobium sp. SH527]|uniref:MarR family winged helix-turn-helix transcriptional regulator n=1 Tax=Planctomicrobium sp. SH527 TaxID=3448123 RepID=UPI003F5AF0E6
MTELPLDPCPGWIAQWNQFSRKLRRLLSDRYAEIGLNDSRANVLEALSGQTQPATQAELANLLVISESNLSGLIERMRIEGLLTRERCSIDRRRMVLKLTSTGVELSESVRAIHSQVEHNWHQYSGDSQTGSDAVTVIELPPKEAILSLYPQGERRAA